MILRESFLGEIREQRELRVRINSRGFAKGILSNTSWYRVVRRNGNYSYILMFLFWSSEQVFFITLHKLQIIDGNSGVYWYFGDIFIKNSVSSIEIANEKVVW